MTLTREARGECDLREAELRGLQELIGALDAEAERETVRRLTRRHPERAREVVNAHAHGLRELRDAQRAMQTSLHEVSHPCDVRWRETAAQVRSLLAQKLEIPVLAIAGEKGVGQNHEALVRAFASNLRGSLVVPGAGHFLAEERPREIAAALASFLAEG